MDLALMLGPDHFATNLKEASSTCGLATSTRQSSFQAGDEVAAHGSRDAAAARTLLGDDPPPGQPVDRPEGLVSALATAGIPARPLHGPTEHPRGERRSYRMRTPGNPLPASRVRRLAKLGILAIFAVLLLAACAVDKKTGGDTPASRPRPPRTLSASCPARSLATT